ADGCQTHDTRLYFFTYWLYTFGNGRLMAEMKTVPEIIGDLKDLYCEHFGVPHANKAYPEKSKSILNPIGLEGKIC
ncbi:uncharacterized protein METZ01_LOCUS482413, partial [marine metagenome]